MVALLEHSLRLTGSFEDWDIRRNNRISRQSSPAKVPTFRLDHSVSARRRPQVMMELRELSNGGLDATCDIPLNHGELLSVRLPAREHRPAYSTYARVTTCKPTGSGYKIAIEFESMCSAA